MSENKPSESRIGAYKRAIDTRTQEERDKETVRRNQKAEKITKAVHRNLEQGITDMPASPKRRPVLSPHLDDETFQIVRDTFSAEGVTLDKYAKQVGPQADEHRIAVTQVLDRPIEPSPAYREALAIRGISALADRAIEAVKQNSEDRPHYLGPDLN